MQGYRLGVGILGWLCLGMSWAAAQPSPPIPGATVSAGQQYFVRYCSACHGLRQAAAMAQPLRLCARRQRISRVWRSAVVGTSP